MESIYPEDRVVDAVSDTVCASALRYLHCTTHAKRAQRSVIEGGSSRDV
jgi:hypothetical protein